MIKQIFLVLVLSIYMYGVDSAQIIKKIEDNLNGKSANMDITMLVHTKKTKRTMQMSSLSVGKEKSFIKILYPKKDKGITFLKLDHVMWQYVPKIERIIKIPASMMLQSWMGSDFSNDDLVRESSLSKDYEVKVLGEDDSSYTLELIPKEDASVVWGKLDMKVSKKYYLPLSVNYYDEDEILVRVLNYKDVKKFGEKYYPTYWEMLPKTEDKLGHKTIMKVDKAIFDEDIKDSYFTKNGLKRYSR